MWCECEARVILADTKDKIKSRVPRTDIDEMYIFINYKRQIKLSVYKWRFEGEKIKTFLSKKQK